MVPLKPMDIDVALLDAHPLTLTAPLACHVNDKGNAFGGSLASIMTLACWGLMTATTREHGLDCDVYVGETAVRYLKPVEENLSINGFFDDANEVDAFLEQLRAKGKARLEMTAQTVLAEGVVAATLTGKFVAFVRKNP